MKKYTGSNAIVSQKPGPVFTENDPAKFHGEGKRSGKTPSNGVEQGPHGTTFLVNSTHIPTPNADKPAKESKVIKTGPGDHLPAEGDCKDASTEGTGGGLPHYPLKDSYEKGSRSHARSGGVDHVTDTRGEGGFHNRAMK